MADLFALGWTQKQLAARIGCAQSVISDLASGKTGNPIFSTGAALVSLHQAKSLPSPELIGADGAPPVPEQEAA